MLVSIGYFLVSRCSADSFLEFSSFNAAMSIHFHIQYFITDRIRSTLESDVSCLPFCLRGEGGSLSHDAPGQAGSRTPLPTGQKDRVGRRAPPGRTRKKDTLGRRKRRAVVGISRNVNGMISCLAHDKIMSFYERYFCRS